MKGQNAAHRPAHALCAAATLAPAAGVPDVEHGQTLGLDMWLVLLARFPLAVAERLGWSCQSGGVLCDKCGVRGERGAAAAARGVSSAVARAALLPAGGTPADAAFTAAAARSSRPISTYASADKPARQKAHASRKWVPLISPL